MTGSEVMSIDGRALWAYAVESDGGLRVRLDLSDWEQLGLYRGQRVQVRRPGRPDDWQFLAEVVELPPVVWVVLARRVGALTRHREGVPSAGR